MHPRPRAVDKSQLGYQDSFFLCFLESFFPDPLKEGEQGERVFVRACDVHNDVDAVCGDGGAKGGEPFGGDGTQNWNHFFCGQRFGFLGSSSKTVYDMVPRADEGLGEGLADVACCTEDEDVWHSD